MPILNQKKKATTLNDKPKGAQQKDQGFAAMTFDLDQGLGILLKKIKELDIEDNTYIIYMSDNGSVPNIPGAKKYEKSYNYPLSRGKWDALEGGVRVPLIIAGPGIKSGLRICHTCFGIRHLTYHIRSSWKQNNYIK